MKTEFLHDEVTIRRGVPVANNEIQNGEPTSVCPRCGMKRIKDIPDIIYDKHGDVEGFSEFYLCSCGTIEKRTMMSEAEKKQFKKLLSEQGL